MSGDTVTLPNLTKEQQEFLDQCEKDFANRYTEEDEDYVQDKKIVPPPLVTPWYARPERNNRDWRGKRHDWRGRDWRGRDYRNRDRGYERDRSFERDRGYEQDRSFEQDRGFERQQNYRHSFSR